MGTDFKIEVLIESRNEILEDILHNMRNWDNTIESGIDIIESNQSNFSNLKDLNTNLYTLTGTFTNDEEYIYKLNYIMQELEKLTSSLKDKKNTLLDGKQQLSKKNRVINSYISINEEPIFIDKDVQ